MMESLFTMLSRAVEGSSGLALGAALVWGVLSILLSPCHLASIPLIVGFIDQQGRITMRRAFTISLLFSVGILLTIAVIGVITAAAGRMMGDIGGWGNYAVAVIFFVVGLYLLEVIRLPLPGAAQPGMKRKGLLAAFVLGLVFGIALGPCTFAFMAPMLAVTFKLAATNLAYGIMLLVLYGVGHCGVIVLAGTFTEAVQHYLDWNEKSKQQARRVLDRLVGYMLSPLLWKKIRRGLSAGRVQSVAVRVICEREAEREAFQPEEYWTITANLAGNQPPAFSAKLTEIDRERVTVRSEAQASQVLQDLEQASFAVSNIDQKEKRRNPAPPFVTSRLQQDSARKLRFPAKKTMMLAQRLYEGIEIGGEGQVGLITYMRTDSTRISADALEELRGFIQTSFGAPYLPANPNIYKTQKAAQEAHEAIRPTSVHRDPEMLRPFLEPDLYKLYKLIWNRFVAAQMTSGVDLITQVDIKARQYTFRASGTVEKFDGYRRVYREEAEPSPDATPTEDETAQDSNTSLPNLSVGESLALVEGEGLGIQSKQHFTQPPARFNEALLIRAMEDKGIGRPSTYATIISTIQDRHYVAKEEGRFRPTELGRMVNESLVGHFPKIFDVEFTAKMESELDGIEEGEKDWITTVKEFYVPFAKSLESAEINMEDVKGKEEPTEIPCDKCGQFFMVVKWGRHGHFLACPGYPECKNTKQFTKDESGAIQVVEELVETSDEPCEKCGSTMILKRGRFGSFFACEKYPDCKTTKPVKLGVKCPAEGCTGDLVQKRTKKGRTFFSCSKYPTCKFALWDKPINRPCPKCHTPFLIEKVRKQEGKKILCHKEDCGYQEAS